MVSGRYIREDSNVLWLVVVVVVDTLEDSNVMVSSRYIRIYSNVLWLVVDTLESSNVLWLVVDTLESTLMYYG